MESPVRERSQLQTTNGSKSRARIFVVVTNGSERGAHNLAWQFEQHVQNLQAARLRLAELIALDGSAPNYTDGATREKFDAQAWGVMHYMLFGRPDERADRLNAVARLLLEGKSSADAHPRGVRQHRIAGGRLP